MNKIPHLSLFIKPTSIRDLPELVNAALVEYVDNLFTYGLVQPTVERSGLDIADTELGKLLNQKLQLIASADYEKPLNGGVLLKIQHNKSFKANSIILVFAPELARIDSNSTLPNGLHTLSVGKIGGKRLVAFDFFAKLPNHSPEQFTRLMAPSKTPEGVIEVIKDTACMVTSLALDSVEEDFMKTSTNHFALTVYDSEGVIEEFHIHNTNLRVAPHRLTASAGVTITKASEVKGSEPRTRVRIPENKLARVLPEPLLSSFREGNVNLSTNSVSVGDYLVQPYMAFGFSSKNRIR